MVVSVALTGEVAVGQLPAVDALKSFFLRHRLRWTTLSSKDDFFISRVSRECRQWTPMPGRFSGPGSKMAISC